MHEFHKGKYFFGTVKVGEKGQIVIPSNARKIFDIKPGDSVIVMGDKRKGLAIIKGDKLKEFTMKILGNMETNQDEEDIGGE
jgi:AbrB family looped-hinge helix DNA binding protein